MPNPKASSSTKGYRQSIKSKDSSGNFITTTNFTTDTVRQGSTAQPRGSSGGGSGNAVELFIVGGLFIWLIVSGKMKAVIEAGIS